MDHHDGALPSQTPNYQQRQRAKTIVIVVMTFAAIAALVVGIMLVDYGFDREDGAARDVLWLGIAIILVVALTPLILLAKAIVMNKREKPRRQPGTVQLHSVASAYRYVDADMGHMWELTSQMEIRLDTGHTCRGIYLGRVQSETLRQWWWRAFPPEKGRLRRRIKPQEALEEWFHVGNKLPCLYNPTNPDVVVVFPFATQSDGLTLNGADSQAHMHFESAT